MYSELTTKDKFVIGLAFWVTWMIAGWGLYFWEQHRHTKRNNHPRD